jgi:hypothetical protein
LGGGLFGVLIFSGLGTAMGTSLFHRVRLLGCFARLLGLRLMAGPRGRIRREEGYSSYREETGQRAQASVHSMAPCETHVTNTVRTKRSRDAWPVRLEKYHHAQGAIVTSAQQTRAK